MSERTSIVGDIRKLLQDFLAPELGELKVRLDTLTEGQKTIIHDMREGFKAQTESRQETEARLLREIKNSEEKLLMRLQLVEANLRMEQAVRVAQEAQREIQQLKREKTQ